MINNEIKLTLALYLFSVSVILYLKPPVFFNKEGKLKEFGIGEEKTLYPLWMIFMLSSIFSFYLIFIFIY